MPSIPKLASAGRELAAFARQALLLPRDVAQPVVPYEARSGDDVVVCLHGLFATAGVLRPLRESLERYPRVHTATFTYPAGPDVKALARRLSELLSELPGGVRVHLLGHSLGGIVARYHAQEVGDPRVVQTISIATPFGGVRHLSALGKQLGVSLAQDLAPSSPMLRSLMLGSRRALALPHLSVVAERDRVAGSPLTHALPGGDVIMIRDCGHNTTLFSDEVAARVTRRVLDAAGDPRRPATHRSGKAVLDGVA